MTPDIARLRELLAKATPGQWRCTDGPAGYQHRISSDDADGETVCDVERTSADAALIAAAVNFLRSDDFKALLAMADAVEKVAAKWEKTAERTGVRTFTGNDHLLFANELRAATGFCTDRCAREGRGMDDTTIAAEPLALTVPLGDLKETDLMAALEFVVDHWRYGNCIESEHEICRAVAWLHAKYGFLAMQMTTPSSGGEKADG